MVLTSRLSTPRTWLVLVLFTLLCRPLLVAAGPCAQLFISEAIYGVDKNQAVEIYNPTDSAISLGAFRFAYYLDGDNQATSTRFQLNNVQLAPADTFVIANADADGELRAKADQLYTGPSFDGDDLVALEGADFGVDDIGCYRVQPMPAWSGPCGISLDSQSIRRQADSTITFVSDNTCDEASFGDLLCANFVGQDRDNYSNLGSHRSTCHPSSDPTSVAVLLYKDAGSDFQDALGSFTLSSKIGFRVTLDMDFDFNPEENLTLTNAALVSFDAVSGSTRTFADEFVGIIEAECDGLVRVCVTGIAGLPDECASVTFAGCLSRALDTCAR